MSLFTPKPVADRTYDYTDLLRVYMDSRSYTGSAFQHVKQYYERFSSTLSGLLGVEFEPTAGGHGPWLFLMRGTMAAYVDARTPWDNMIEGSGLGIIGEFCDSHGARLIAARDALRAELFQMMCDLFESRFGKVEKIVTSAELREAGFDDRAAPDPMENW
jgi:hypothetical protein